MAQFEYQHELACSVEGAFEFLTQPKNVVELVHPESNVTLLSAPPTIHQGAELEFEIEAWGQTQSMMHQIVEFERPSRIVEEMIHGPMKEWVHEHVFEESGSGVLLTDRIMFETPGGLVGLLLTEKRIRSSLEQGFQHRRQLLEDLVQSGELQ
jgi:ligand-binding SRPBCC domain-containing protein